MASATASRSPPEATIYARVDGVIRIVEPFRFADLLQDVGIPAHMAHPLSTKAISSARVKNDRVDAKTLAHLREHAEMGQ